MDSRRKILKDTTDLDPQDIRFLYDGFTSPVTELDCGTKCAPHNPSGKPFCCDILHAIPAAYKSEWKYFKESTDLWHRWRGDPGESQYLKANTPENMLLLACLGPAQCQRDFRALSCRQFPFFPYMTSDYRFIGLAYEWQFEDKCWVISNLARVTHEYREAFVRTYDRLFALFQHEFEQYAYHSGRLRQEFIRCKRRFPLLHRGGDYYLVSPASERLQRVGVDRLPRFGFYRTS